jgi:hypothetical protein
MAPGARGEHGESQPDPGPWIELACHAARMDGSSLVFTYLPFQTVDAIQTRTESLSIAHSRIYPPCSYCLQNFSAPTFI